MWQLFFIWGKQYSQDARDGRQEYLSGDILPPERELMNLYRGVAMFNLFRSKKALDIIKQAEIIVNTHSYKICDMCQEAEKRDCKCYCLPAEMFALLVYEKDREERLDMIEKVEELFIDK